MGANSLAGGDYFELRAGSGYVRVLATERTAEGEKLKEQYPQRPHVRWLAVRLAPKQLRRHVGGRAAV